MVAPWRNTLDKSKHNKRMLYIYLFPTLMTKIFSRV